MFSQHKNPMIPSILPNFSRFINRYIAMILTALFHSKHLGKSYKPSTALVFGVFLTAIGYMFYRTTFVQYFKKVFFFLKGTFASLLYI